MENITLVCLDDWQALFIDDEKIFENHKISSQQILDLLEIHYEKIYLEDNQWNIDNGIPDSLRELKDNINV